MSAFRAVRITDNKGNFASVDSLSNKLVSISQAHHEIHDGNSYMFPVASFVYPLFVNLDLFKAAGIDMARTIGARVWGLVEGNWASDHDALIANKIAHILCGGSVAAGTELSEQAYLDLEREAFLSLCGQEKSQARMQSILMTNKPLRN